MACPIYDASDTPRERHLKNSSAATSTSPRIPTEHRAMLSLSKGAPAGLPDASGLVAALVRGGGPVWNSFLKLKTPLITEDEEVPPRIVRAASRGNGGSCAENKGSTSPCHILRNSGSRLWRHVLSTETKPWYQCAQTIELILPFRIP